MNLDEMRNQIDQIDLQMQELFKKRMAISKAIGQFKKDHHLPVLDSNRERDLFIKRRASLGDEALWPLYESFLKEIMRLSKEIQ